MIRHNERPEILIVDDNAKNIQVLGNLLRDNGYDLAFALSAKEALQLLRKKDFDLFLLDVMMPEINGFELCEMIRENDEAKDIPVIFLTADTNSQSIIRGFAAGGSDYVTKPFNSAELLSRVKTHLEVKQSRDILKSMNKLLEEKVEKRTKELNLANKKLSKLERAKSDFLALISHELRTPLNTLVMLEDLFESSAKTQDDIENIGFLRKATKKLLDFVKVSTLITSISLANYKMHFVAVDVKTATKKVIDRIAKECQCKKISILQNDFIDSDGKAKIIVDIELFEFCLRRIIKNAIKYSTEYDNILVNTFKVGSSVVLEVVDNGPGFSAEMLSKLFETFVVEDTMHHHEGLGLSLSAIKIIMDAFSGGIEVKNLPSRGATVKLIFKS